MAPFAPGFVGVRRCAPSASLLFAALAVFVASSPADAAGVSPSKASAEQKKVAQDRYLEGAKLYEAGRFDEALTAFRASHEIVASPNSHLMLARSLRKKGDLVAAYGELLETEIEADALEKDDPKYASAVMSAAADRGEIRPRIGLLTVRVKGGDGSVRVRVAGRELPKPLWGKQIAVPPGAVEITAKGGAGKMTRGVALAAGGAMELELDLAELAKPSAIAPLAANPEPHGSPAGRTSLTPYAAIAAGVGVAGIGVFAVAGAMNRSTYASVKDICPGAQCGPEQHAAIDRGRTQQTIANVGLVVGLVGVGAGVGLFVLDRSRGTSDAPTTAMAVGPGSISLERSF